MSANHGTYTRYAVYGCRCPACVSQQRERVGRNRADRLLNGRLNHGTRSSYDAGCRCDSCRAARQRALDVDRAARQRHRQEATTQQEGPSS